MATCTICKTTIQELFLGKIKGTLVKKKGKVYPVCFECQKKLNNDKQKILTALS